MTAVGLCLGVASGIFFAFHALPPAFVFGGLSVFCDVLDGTIARKFHSDYVRRVFDSIADRISEFEVVLGALIGGIIEPIGLIAAVGSASLFTARTISHAAGLKSDQVMFGRVERLIFILIGLVSPIVAISTVCFVVAGMFGLVSSSQIIAFLVCGNMQGTTR